MVLFECKSSEYNGPDNCVRLKVNIETKVNDFYFEQPKRDIYFILLKTKINHLINTLWVIMLINDIVIIFLITFNIKLAPFYTETQRDYSHLSHRYLKFRHGAQCKLSKLYHLV